MIKTIQLLSSTAVRVGHVTLSPWPTFKVEGSCENLPSLLFELLLSSNPTAMLWSAKVPNELRQIMLSFPESQMPEMFRLSQIWPDKFIDWSIWCPALITLLIQTKPMRW